MPTLNTQKTFSPCLCVRIYLAAIVKLIVKLNTRESHAGNNRVKRQTFQKLIQDCNDQIIFHALDFSRHCRHRLLRH